MTVVMENADRQTVAEIPLRRLGTAEARYAASHIPEVTGEFRLLIDDRQLRPLNLEARVEVLAPDDELRRPETDHALLAQLAAGTGGHVLEPHELGRLPEILPNRSVRTVNSLTESIWDTPLAFVLVLIVIAGEWIGRKLLRLA